MSTKQQDWHENRKFTPEKLAAARLALDDIRQGRKVVDAIRRHPLPSGGLVGKSALVAVYRSLIESGEWQADADLLQRIRLKPVRTLSGVTTVTVLTEPYPCPGQCIFCPTDARMPKSYLPDEPGARRALDHNFDPYEQVKSRLQALNTVGHPTDKVELLVLGGTWNAYRRDYQAWFIRRCLEAMNGELSPDLQVAQQINETARHRNVGLVIETRPDNIDPDELVWLRSLGVTKVQMGAQSLDDRILDLNKRGHSAAETLKAMQLLRAGGFKIVLHWMPNLLGATPQSDREDFARLWQGYCPDEIKIYPNQLLKNAELFEYWRRGEYRPYNTEQLIELIANIKTTIPAYCRVNRVIRDIPSTNVVAGNKRSSLRQDVQLEMKKRGWRCQCIRCREVRGQKFNLEALRLDELAYAAGASQEYFLSFVTDADQLAGFLRLSLPGKDAPKLGAADLTEAAIIREVHIYGQSLEVGEDGDGVAQHSGLGRRLVERAEQIARKGGFARLAVISAIGTRRYYARLGFERGEYYMQKSLNPR